MPKSFENSKGKTYFIKSKLTKKGNTTYYMTRKEDESCLSALPEGYEVFEKYDSGSMFVRKKQISLFNLKEINAIKASLDKNESVVDYRINITGKEMAIYTVEKEIDASRLGSPLISFYKMAQTSHPPSWRNFAERMKVIIHQNKSGTEFEVQRYCYRGSIDDWITIGVEADIAEVGNKYLIHLGKASYYELNFGY
jgi:hypothetical protein